ncbi:MAG: hypothetical protein H8E12_20650 [Rhodobacteraceae bacterium]|nr:hypothetical protein [Paracoccaceae bacterium]
MNVEALKKHMTPFIELIKDSGSEYFWIASGAIRDYFTTGGVTPKDLDIFFPNKKQRDKAINHLKYKGFEIISYLPRERGATFNLAKKSVPEEYSYLAQGEGYAYHSIDIGCWDGRDEDLGQYARTPEGCISWFDFTIEMAALDSNNKFFCHPNFEHHIKNKILIRNSIRHAFPRGNNRRLLKYIKNGFTIDQENLLLWLEDQEATFEYRKKVNQKKLK